MATNDNEIAQAKSKSKREKVKRRLAGEDELEVNEDEVEVNEDELEVNEELI